MQLSHFKCTGQSLNNLLTIFWQHFSQMSPSCKGQNWKTKLRICTETHDAPDFQKLPEKLDTILVLQDISRYGRPGLCWWKTVVFKLFSLDETEFSFEGTIRYANTGAMKNLTSQPCCCLLGGVKSFCALMKTQKGSHEDVSVWMFWRPHQGSTCSLVREEIRRWFRVGLQHRPYPRCNNQWFRTWHALLVRHRRAHAFLATNDLFQFQSKHNTGYISCFNIELRLIVWRKPLREDWISNFPS